MDVVTLGETMVLFTPDSMGLMRYAHSYSRKFGGAESNFAIGLARLGHQAGWISKVGNDEFGKAMVSFIRGEGVDVSQVKVDPEAATGIYFKELRTTDDVRVYYYRKDSAASRLGKEDIDESYIKKAKYLFVSGITPALSESCYEALLYAISTAKKNNVPVVFDPNLRKKLWSEERAREVLLHVAAQADIVLPGVAEGQFLFGSHDPDQLGQRFLALGAATVVIKLGPQGAAYYTNEKSQRVAGFHVKHVVDPVGAGDGFAAGFISGLLDGKDLFHAVQRGNAVGAMVTMINGDVEGLPDQEDVRRFMHTPIDEVSR